MYLHEFVDCITITHLPVACIKTIKVLCLENNSLNFKISTKNIHTYRYFSVYGIILYCNVIMSSRLVTYQLSDFMFCLEIVSSPCRRTTKS